MAYNEFAYFYDEFNGEADYDALYGCQGVVLTSAENGLGMDELRALLEGSMTPETED